MDLTVSSKVIANFECVAVQLVPILGAYELVFQLRGTVHGKSDEMYRCVTIPGVRVAVKSKGGHSNEIGLAKSDKGAVVRQLDNTSPSGMELKLPLLQHQIELLEVARDGHDIDFSLKFLIRGSSSKNPNHDWDEPMLEMPVHVAESAWIAQLNSSHASRILLFEIRMPVTDGMKTRHPAERHLVRAQELFSRGNWRECVAECRQFAEELGGTRLAAALDRLKDNRQSMDKDEREAVIIAALQHYGHSAAHSGSKHGELNYERDDAKLTLSLAASLASYHFRVD